jgi:hypothetical protein
MVSYKQRKITYINKDGNISTKSTRHVEANVNTHERKTKTTKQRKPNLRNTLENFWYVFKEIDLIWDKCKVAR